MRTASWRVGLAMAALAAMGSQAQAQKSADTLRVVWWDQIANVNPYYNSLRAGLVLAHQTMDGLIYRDPNGFVLKPALATKWEYIDPTSIRFELRHGVTWPDGSPFTADDVVYTINNALTDKQLMVPSNYSWIAGIDKVDDFTVVLHLKKIFPAALEFIAMVTPIQPKAYREKVGSDAFDKLPMGIGPYTITKVDGVNEIDLIRNESYYKDSPKGRPAIGKVIIHEVVDASVAQNEIIGGRADWTWNVLPDNVPKLAALPFLKTEAAETMRVNFLNLDAAGRTDPKGPLTNQKVRQAIEYAIDRGSISKNLMAGSRVPDAPCFPTQFGCDAAAAVKYPYDPAKAKALLAEAGYPNGFDTELVSFQLSTFEGAVQNYLKAVGINVKVSHLQVQASVQRAQEGKSPIDFTNWGSYSINDVSAFLPNFYSGASASGFAPSDAARDQTLTDLIKAAGATTDLEVRKKDYAEAIHRITDEAYMIPMFTGVAFYAYRKELNFKPWPDEVPRFYMSSWN
jgi:peptide/nickel transport system substrate-binding protein